MLEQVREVVQRLLRSRDAPLDNAEAPGKPSYNGKESSADRTGAFERFLRDYKARVDEEFEEGRQVRQRQPRTCGPPDSPSVPTRK
jgi:hypothetical protein